MKKLIVSVSVLLLVGAGCAAAPPSATPSGTVPAQPSPGSGTPAVPAVPAKPVGKPTNVPLPNPGGINPANSEDRVVVFTTDAKFDPVSVAVHVGHTVTWLNQSNQPVWPASNPHPYHTDCPGFDPKQPIPPGGSWSFTFTKAEVCNYHNHLSTGDTGLVTVTPVGR